MINRRNFLKSAAVVAVPAIVPVGLVSASTTNVNNTSNSTTVSFRYDGKVFEPDEYLTELQKFQTATHFRKDRYGKGGAVEALEKKFTEITGKESAIYMPSGSMANQLAIKVLSGDNAKIFVQDVSHIHRDEADAAQTIHNKRLMPLAIDGTYFTAEELKEAVEALPYREHFNTGIGVVAVENPVRAKDGRMVPIEEIKKISAYCRQQNIKLHLDGARIYMASARTGISVKEYANYFDTVYISLYKYLGASGGAILCGDKTVIDKMPLLIKQHGGSVFGNWLNAAMALNRVEGIEQRLKDTKKRSEELVNGLNGISGIKVSLPKGGTNLYYLDLSKEIDGIEMSNTLESKFNILLRNVDENNRIKLLINETLLYQSADYVINAFRKSI